MKFYVVGGERPEKIEKIWLTDEVERLRRMSTVCVTVDVFPICEGRIVAFWRTLEPMANMWLTSGGAMKVGESPNESAVRIFEGDTGLERKPEDFQYIHNGKAPDQYLMLVKSPLGDYWRQDSCLYYALVITPKELANIKLSPKEFDPKKIKLFTFNEAVEKTLKGELEGRFGLYASHLLKSGLIF